MRDAVLTSGCVPVLSVQAAPALCDGAVARDPGKATCRLLRQTRPGSTLHHRWPTDLLAEKEDWGPLYNADRLADNDVPCAAVLYYEDMFVNFKLAEVTCGIGRGGGCRGGYGEPGRMSGPIAGLAPGGC